MPHRASRSDLFFEEWQELEDAPFHITSPQARMDGDATNDLVRAALKEHLRLATELASRLERALSALEHSSQRQALTG